MNDRDRELHADFVVQRLYPGGGTIAVRKILTTHTPKSIWRRAQRLGVRFRRLPDHRPGDAYISALTEIMGFDKAAAAQRMNIHPDTLKRALVRDGARRVTDPEGWKTARRAARDAIILKHLKEILK